MSWTDRTREQEILLDWACKHKCTNILEDKWETEQDSYFLPVAEEKDVTEYSITALPELKEKLQAIWGNDEVMERIIVPCCVATFKERSKERGKINLQEQSAAPDLRLPDFVYVF